jgi:alpha-amylase
MDAQTTQDDVIYLIVTDRFFGANKKSVEPSNTSIHGGTLDGIIDIFWRNSL